MVAPSPGEGWGSLPDRAEAALEPASAGSASRY